MSVQYKLIETIQCEKGLERKQMLIKFFFKIHMCNIGSRTIAIYYSINCSYNNIARSISLLDKITIFVCTGKFSYK